MTTAVTKYQVDQLIDSVKGLTSEIKQIREEDIPNLRQENIATKTRMNIFTGLNIGAIVLGVIGARILR